MGIEWNLLKEPQEDIDKLAEWVAEFKKHREWFAVDTVVHSDAADPAVRLDGVVMPNQAAASTVSPSSPPRRPTRPRRYACPDSTLTRCMRCRRLT